jgi:hypothetical protein
MLPLGIIYFVIATVGLSIGVNLSLAPLAVLGENLGWLDNYNSHGIPFALGNHMVRLTTTSWVGSLFMLALGIVALTVVMHAARGIVRVHARLAKALLVEPGS